jgi:hypothetical protein
MARVTYDDGCVTEAQSPCQQQQKQGSPQEDPQGGIGGISTTHVVLGTAALVGGGVAAWFLLSRKDKPASP